MHDDVGGLAERMKAMGIADVPGQRDSGDGDGGA